MGTMNSQGVNSTINSDALEAGKRLSSPDPGEEVVISGLAGTYPDSNDVYHFRDNLYNKVDLVSDDDRRWKLNHPEIPQRAGKIYNVQKFDSVFFGLHPRDVYSMDPMSRIVLEKAVEAILDAGVNPSELKGSKTAVVYGICASETETEFYYENPVPNAQSFMGSTRSNFANRVSYFFGLNGPSFVLDTACSSSVYAFEHAYRALREGACDSCLVLASNLCLNPFFTLEFFRLGVLSIDGSSKCFDETANGYARSEAICAVYLQKAKDARRIYAKVVHAKVNCDGYKEQGITFPSRVVQKELFEQFYEECGVDPSTISFLEAHATGTRAGDPEEIAAIDSVFCAGRTKPLPIGSVKSNMGHSEACAGLCSLSKVIIGLECGYVPPNINYISPRKDIEALEKGKVVVVTEKMQWSDDNVLVAINSFGFGGANGHILLEWNHKQKNRDNVRLYDNLPMLVCVSGRTKKSIKVILNDVAEKIDREFVSLIHRAFRYNINGHKYRGFSIISKTGEISRSFNHFTEERKQLYFIFGGLKLNALTVCNQLFVFPQFAATVQRIHDILLPIGINMLDVLTNYEEKYKNNVIYNVVGNTVLQIALVNILKELQIIPDKIIGYSVGELTCAYVDGSLTLEQTVLAAYYLATGLNSHNIDANNAKGQKKSSSKFTSYLKKIIPDSKPRSKKWLSDNGEYVSAEYFCNNIFKDEISTQNLPKENFLFLEIGQPALHSKTGSGFGLVDYINTNIVEFFLTGLGKLYEAGYNPKIDKLYPKLLWPVSRGTPMISPLIKWDHSKDWFTKKHTPSEKRAYRVFRINVKNEDWAYVTGHVIDGRNLFPATGYLYLVFQALSSTYKMIEKVKKIVFENIKFLRATNVPKRYEMDLEVMLQKGNGNFEVTEGGVTVVSGRLYTSEDFPQEIVDLPLPTNYTDTNLLPLGEKDIYKELRLRGYNYSGLFRMIKSCDNEATKGYIKWKNNWVAFMDNLLQMKILQLDSRSLYVPTSIARFSFDLKQHLELVEKFADGEEVLLPVYVNKEANIITSIGTEIRGLSASPIPRRKPLGDPVLESYRFIPNEASLHTKQSVRVNLQILLENMLTYKVKVVEVIDNVTRKGIEPLGPIIHEVLSDQPLVQTEILILSDKPLEAKNVTVENKTITTQSNCSLVVSSNIFRSGALHNILGVLKENGFFLSREGLDFDRTKLLLRELEILTVHTTVDEKLVLCRASSEYRTPTVVDVSESLGNFKWLPTLQESIKNDHSVIVLSQDDPLSGVIGLVNCIRREPDGENVKCVGIFDNAPKFEVKGDFYNTQLKKNMAVNIYKDGKWGTYRHLLLQENTLIESEHCYVNSTVSGDLSSLRWIEGTLTSTSGTDGETKLVHVYYSALNFKDIMLASGRITGDLFVKSRLLLDCVQGSEYSGRDSSGKRVMGMVGQKAFSTLLEADSYMTWPVPDRWSLEEAATVPIVYSTIIYALVMVGKIQRGNSILIHAGSGGIGQAAINLALHYGCTIFTTVGTNEKRGFIKERFPQISDCRIGNSRDTSFEQMIMKETYGRGVDYVLNSLAEEKLQASVRCVAPGGAFLELGKFDLANDSSLGLQLFSKGATFHGIMFDVFFTMQPEAKRRIYNEVLRFVEDGVVRPLTKKVFEWNEIEKAYRYMAAGKHIGKVLIKIKTEEKEKLVLPSPKILKGVLRYTCNPKKSYIITGGLGGFGLELADWLILRGAKNLILVSRIGVKTGYQDMRIRIWKSYGVRVKVSTVDITKIEGCALLIREAQELGLIEGIFNLAVLLRDAILENQTEENYITSFGPKAVATRNLDDVSRELCPGLRDFVVFSSVSCGRGNAGQTNYGMANSVMERICEQRRNDGLPGLAIQWGAVGEVGLVADIQEEHAQLEIGGTLQQTINSCLNELNFFLKQNDPVVSSMVVAEKRGRLGGADNIVDAVVNILGIRDKKTVSLHSSLVEVGMDSIMAVEIKQTLEREFEVFLTAKDMRLLTFTRLQEISMEKETRQRCDRSANANQIQSGGQLLFRCVGDEKLSNMPIIRMNTRSKGNEDSPTILMLPGLEGMSVVFEHIAAQLSARAVCLQYCYNDIKETISDIVKEVLQHALQELRGSTHFTIVAYSFGCVVALELAALLEQEGRRGKIVLIDGSQKMLATFLRQQMRFDQEDLFQIDVLSLIMSHFTSLDTILTYQNEMTKCKTLGERLHIAVENAPKDLPYSKTYHRQLCIATFKRIKAIITHKPMDYKLKSAVKLYRPTQYAMGNVAEDYELSQSTVNPVEVSFFEGDHYTIMQNTKLSDAINSLM